MWLRRALFGAVVVWTALGGVPRTSELDAAARRSPAAGITLVGVRYSLRVELGSARHGAEGVSMRTDLGYELILRRAYVVSHSASFAPCAPPPMGGAEMSPIRSLSMPRAHASHSGRDDSAARRPKVEDLLREGIDRWDELAFPARRYCRFHYLVARANERAEGLPVDPDLVGSSLHVELDVRDLEGRAIGSRTIHSSLPNGRLYELRDLGLAAGAEPRQVEVTITRKLDTLFDGIAFDTADDATLQRDVLANLLRTTRVDARLVAPPEARSHSALWR